MMATLRSRRGDAGRSAALVIRSLIVVLTLATAAIHATLGGPLFTANAIGYGALALAMVLPGPIGRIRWLVRIAMVVFTAITIGGWVLSGPRFNLAYVDKGIEVALIGLLALELWRDRDGRDVARKVRHAFERVAARSASRTEVSR
jgi:hypothetical protein